MNIPILQLIQAYETLVEDRVQVSKHIQAVSGSGTKIEDWRKDQRRTVVVLVAEIDRIDSLLERIRAVEVDVDFGEDHKAILPPQWRTVPCK